MFKSSFTWAVLTVSDNLREVSVYLYSNKKAGCIGVSSSVNKPQLIWWLKGRLYLGKGRAVHCYEVLRNTISLLLPSF